jgi:hypothetical protein
MDWVIILMFIFRYFFMVMTALIIIGLINGLALLPVLLSLIGPPSEVTPNDGGSRLPAPPPISSSTSKSKKSRNGGGLSLNTTPSTVHVVTEMQVQQQPSNIVYSHQHQGSLLSTISEEESGEAKYKIDVHVGVHLAGQPTTTTHHISIVEPTPLQPPVDSSRSSLLSSADSSSLPVTTNAPPDDGIKHNDSRWTPTPSPTPTADLLSSSTTSSRSSSDESSTTSSL